ncbi:hypothetical protein NHX12_017732 [Muraenolepis orangiensis]|uniref:DZANK-type domain-containing protein n=1 Tax=Muraenolepis orangiensis TaxID=630683 RepID=A0A9Q0IYB8_9TELE|nr:hypothetical protein NHX12_017732 [Muraenolepis orangiensis]
MAVCVVCNTLVPINTPTCLICEAPSTAQLRPQTSLKLQDQAAPPLPPAEDHRVSCSKCHRINNHDARYCDWCGSKHSHPLSRVLCRGCGGSSPPHASYCSSCGLLLMAPPQSHTLSHGHAPSHHPSAGRAASLQKGSPMTSNGVTWRPLRSTVFSHSGSHATPFEARAPPTADRQTQTVGLFYPSATELLRSHQQRTLVEQAGTRRPPLTAVSPGRGFWRKQVDHTCAHLRSYAQNNPHFRALLGEPRMGRMVSAVIREDDYEVSLKLSFLLARRPRDQETQVSLTPGDQESQRPGDTETKVSLTPRDQESQRPGDTETNASRGSSPQTLSSVTEKSNTTSLAVLFLLAGRTAARQKPLPQTTQKPLDVLLLEEAGPGGGASVAVMQQLLDQGADPMCQDGEGRPVLLVAVATGNHDIIPVLVQKGADINQQSGPLKNTPLHEAALKGSGGLQSARVLLGCRARLRRNTRGETPYDLSLASGCPTMVQLLAAQLGHNLLGRLLPDTKMSLELPEDQL